jgi:DNA-binding response OmpR family regulator
LEDLRILLVEKSPALRKLISSYMGQHGWAVEDSTNLAEARVQIDNRRPDVVLVALEFGADEVLFFLGDLGDGGIDTFVISESTRVQDRIACLEQGAFDFMSKPVDLRELVLRLKRLSRSGSKDALPSNMDIPCGGATLDIASRVLRATGSRPVLLTPAEFRLLYLLLRNEGRIVDRALIARDVLGHSETNLSRSVDVMVSKLRRKLGLAGSGRFVRNVRSEGYVLVREERERLRTTAVLTQNSESNSAYAEEI